MVSRTVIIF